MWMQRSITREDIAEIYDQLGFIEMRKAQNIIADNPETDVSVLDRSFEFFKTADEIRSIEDLKPLVRDRANMLVRSESSSW